MTEIQKNPNKYIDSYDNECFAPQEFEECTVISMLTHIKTV